MEEKLLGARPMLGYAVEFDGQRKLELCDVGLSDSVD